MLHHRRVLPGIPYGAFIYLLGFSFSGILGQISIDFHSILRDETQFIKSISNGLGHSNKNILLTISEINTAYADLMFVCNLVEICLFGNPDAPPIPKIKLATVNYILE